MRGIGKISLAAAVLTLGCSGEPRATAEPAATRAESDPPSAAEAGSDSLPAAILGTAPPPRGESVHYFAADSAATGYLSLPDSSFSGPHPAVILIHEWNGLTDRIRQVADAMADQGYVALAADLYSGRTGGTPEENRSLTEETRADMETVIANLDAAVQFLRARDDVTGRVATMGWCFGGGIALSYALGGERHEGTAIFYGSLVTDPAELAAIDHPIYGTFAEMDRGIPPEEVERFTAALHDAGVPADIHLYDDVNHGFWLHVDEDPETRRAPALDAWQRLKDYLSRTLEES